MLKKCHRNSAGSDNKKDHSAVHGCKREMPFLEILASLQKGGRGKKYSIFAIFLGGTHFCVRHDAKN